MPLSGFEPATQRSADLSQFDHISVIDPPIWEQSQTPIQCSLRFTVGWPLKSCTHTGIFPSVSGHPTVKRMPNIGLHPTPQLCLFLPNIGLHPTPQLCLYRTPPHTSAVSVSDSTPHLSCVCFCLISDCTPHLSCVCFCLISDSTPHLICVCFCLISDSTPHLICVCFCLISDSTPHLSCVCIGLHPTSHLCLFLPNIGLHPTPHLCLFLPNIGLHPTPQLCLFLPNIGLHPTPQLCLYRTPPHTSAVSVSDSTPHLSCVCFCLISDSTPHLICVCFWLTTEKNIETGVHSHMVIVAHMMLSYSVS